ncbi:cupin domain-containing protein [Fictibacillus sp. UD]
MMVAISLKGLNAVQNTVITQSQGSEFILAGIKRESSLIDCYRRLANVAPDQNHKNNISYALEYKKSCLRYFTNLYTSLTGKQPEYERNYVEFQSYEEGLQKTYQAEIEGCQIYQNNSYRCYHPYVQQALLQAAYQKREHAERLGWLKKRIPIELRDYGGNPFVVDIEEATKQNKTYRTALWTGDKLQVTLMSIGVGDDIGLEVHPTTDQFLRIEEGQGLVQMGDSPDNLDYKVQAYDDFAIMIPAGKWHNLTNTGNKPIKLYAIYAPPEHPFGTVHETKAIAMAAEAEE